MARPQCDIIPLPCWLWFSRWGRERHCDAAALLACTPPKTGAQKFGIPTFKGLVSHVVSAAAAAMKTFFPWASITEGSIYLSIYLSAWPSPCMHACMLPTMFFQFSMLNIYHL